MSEKNRDDKNRWRNVTIAFRMSPEENEELNNRVKLSGFRTKQDYIIQSVLHQKVVATGNPLMLVQFRQNLQRIERELERIEKASDMDVRSPAVRSRSPRSLKAAVRAPRMVPLPPADRRTLRSHPLRRAARTLTPSGRRLMTSCSPSGQTVKRTVPKRPAPSRL